MNAMTAYEKLSLRIRAAALRSEFFRLGYDYAPMKEEVQAILDDVKEAVAPPKPEPKRRARKPRS